MIRTWSSTRSTAWHESAHASALLLQHWPPLTCRIDRPTDDLLGATRPDWSARDITRDSMMKLLISVLAGPASDGGLHLHDDWPIAPDTWPDEQHKDADMARFICEWLGFTEVDWRWAIQKTYSLSRKRRFKELQALIAAALEHTELLLQHELVKLMEQTEMYEN